jgi:D-alanine transaminase
MRIVFVNGEFCTEETAKVSIFDRGFLFADGVYEVSSVIDSKLVDNARHLKRLHRSLSELDMVSPLSDAELSAMQKQLIEKNQLNEGLVYLQITRGPAERDFAFPSEAQPSVIAFTQHRSILDNPAATSGLSVITAPDIRWQRCDIKTIGLLPSSLTKQQALNKGADDAWMVDDQGLITEGTSNNCYIVTDDDEVITRQLSERILHGITRRAILKVASESGLVVTERAFSPEEACQAKEAFISSATTFCLPVVRIDNHTIGNGQPGPIFKKIRSAYIEFAKQSLE